MTTMPAHMRVLALKASLDALAGAIRADDLLERRFERELLEVAREELAALQASLALPSPIRAPQREATILPFPRRRDASRENVDLAGVV